MTLEEQLASWTVPSSDTEQDKQERTERMVRGAIDAHPAFKGSSYSVYAKGSYANNTNVRADSDVDIAVQCHEVFYYQKESPEAPGQITPYDGTWTPAQLRSEVEVALRAKFPGQVDVSGTTAIQVNSGSARVDADVVPCFDYRYYFTSGEIRSGTRIFRTTGSHVENFPEQQLEKGKAKNNRTSTSFKKAVRILKRVENAMVAAGDYQALPSFFIECLVYNCPDSILNLSTWTATVKGLLLHLWNGLEGAEPDNSSDRWLEVNECKYLFHSAQKWHRADGRGFSKAAWNYWGFS